MSETCFTQAHVDQYKRRNKGVLQFGETKEVRFEYHKQKDDRNKKDKNHIEIPEFKPEFETNTDKVKAIEEFHAASASYKKYIERLSNYHREIDINMDRQMPRSMQTESLTRGISADERKAMTKLPDHMHTINNRLCCSWH